MAADGFTTVHVTTDPAEGEMLVSVLRDQAIEARLYRVNSALLGAAPHLFQIRIEVAAPQAEAARELLAELGQPGALDAVSEPPDPQEASASDSAPPRRPLRVGIGLLLPGAGHFYARQPWTAVVLELGILAGLVILQLDFETNFQADALFGALFAVIGCDVGGALRAVRALGRGAAIPTPRRQVMQGLVLLGIAALVGTAVATVAAIPGWLSARARDRIEVTCRERELVFANHAKGAREVTLDKVVAGRRRCVYKTTAQGDARMSLAPGAQAGLTLALPDRIVADCRAASVHEPGDCELLFHFVTVDPAATTDSMVEAWGICKPSWGRATLARATLYDPATVDDSKWRRCDEP